MPETEIAFEINTKLHQGQIGKVRKMINIDEQVISASSKSSGKSRLTLRSRNK